MTTTREATALDPTTPERRAYWTQRRTHEERAERMNFRPSQWGVSLDGGGTELLATLTPHEEALMRENHELRAQLEALREIIDDIETDGACALIVYEADVRQNRHNPALVTAHLTRITGRCALVLNRQLA